LLIGEDSVESSMRPGVPTENPRLILHRERCWLGCPRVTRPRCDEAIPDA
jgi:hypothetical protein